MREFELVPMSSIIEDYIDREDPPHPIDRSRYMKFGSDVLTKVYPRQKLQHHVALLQVQDYRARVPDHFDSIVHVAFKPEAERKPVRRWEVVSWVQDAIHGCGAKIELECPKCNNTEGCACYPDIIIEVDELWKRQHPEYTVGMMMDMRRTWASTTNPRGPFRSPYNPNFQMMKPAQNYMFNADYHVNGCLNLDAQVGANTPYEYDFDNPYIRVNSKEGQILLSYYKRVVGPDGYPMVPNVPEVYEAIAAYISSIDIKRQFRRNMNNSNLYNISRSEKQAADLAIARARELLAEVPFGEFWSFVENHWAKVMPYYEFYSNFNATQPDRYRTAMNRLINER